MKSHLKQPRYLKDLIQSDALEDGKIAFLSGPRQVGKTTLAKEFLISEENYFSWDQAAFKILWLKDPAKSIENRGPGPVIIDEIHKDRKWKNRLKGLYDTYQNDFNLIVTGSARMDFYRKGADSLMGRYLPYRVHPFSVAEGKMAVMNANFFNKKADVKFPLKDILRLGGFPEPLLAANENKALRWSRLRLERLVNEDSRDLSNIHDLQLFRSLLELMPSRVGSLFSVNSLREDIGGVYATIRSWVLISEALYYGFFIRPYSKNLKWALTTEPKFYLYDILQIPPGSMGARLENLTALHLLKACHYWTDSAQGNFELQYVRDKSKREVDFLVTKNKKPWVLIECKSNSKQVSPNLKYFSEILKCEFHIQLVQSEKAFEREYPEFNTRVLDYESFFRYLL